MSSADDVLALLLAVRLRGAGDATSLTTALDAMGHAVDDVDTLLGRLELAGLVDAGRGTPARWRLTPDGRAEGERLLAAELDRVRARPQVTSAYTGFLALNGPLLRVCTDWQLRDANPGSIVVNDHTDLAFDRDVLTRLATVHQAVQPICADLRACVARFQGYGTRLASAHDRIEAGDVAALDRSTDSYHHVWFELHEDLVATLGRDRSTEPLPDASA